MNDVLHYTFADLVTYSWLARSLCRPIEMTTNVSENYRLFYATLWQLLLCSARDKMKRTATVLVRVLSYSCSDSRIYAANVNESVLRSRRSHYSSNLYGRTRPPHTHTHTPSIQWAHGPRADALSEHNRKCTQLGHSISWLLEENSCGTPDSTSLSTAKRVPTQLSSSHSRTCFALDNTCSAIFSSAPKWGERNGKQNFYFGRLEQCEQGTRNFAWKR